MALIKKAWFLNFSLQFLAQASQLKIQVNEVSEKRCEDKLVVLNIFFQILYPQIYCQGFCPINPN